MTTTTVGEKQAVDKAEVLRLRAEGVSLRAVAQQLGCSKTYVVQVEQEAKSTPADGIARVVDLKLIRDNPWQTRPLEEDVVAEFADSIEGFGLLETPSGRQMEDGTVQQATGHHRLAAIKRLVSRGAWTGGFPIVIKEISDMEMALMALEENSRRVNLNPYQQLLSYRRALDEIEGLTIQTLADRLNKDRATISNELRVLRLPKEVLDLVASGVVPVRSARELLCLVSDSHAHVDIMMRIIREISETPVGRMPDWRATNIRHLLNYWVHGSRVAEWRRLEKGNGFFGGSHNQGPSFDVGEFQTSFADKVHRIPKDSGDGSELWTCATQQWKNSQDQAAPSGTKGAAGKDKPAPQGLRHLVDDPVGRKVLTDVVSPETAAKAIGRELRLELGDEVILPSESQEDTKALAWQRINQHLAEFLGSHPSQKSRDNLRTSAVALFGSLKLGASGISKEALSSAIKQTVDDFETELAKRVKSPTALSQEAAADLGTRAEVVHLGHSTAGHALDNRAGFQSERPPPYFPDLDECRKTCNFGATYVTTAYSKEPKLRCMNDDHWQEKLERGRGTYKRILQERIDAEDSEDDKVAGKLLIMMPEPLGLPVAAALLGTVNFQENVPVEEEVGIYEMAYTPLTLRTVNLVLGLVPPEKTPGLVRAGRIIDRELALQALGSATANVCAVVASRLLTWTLRNCKDLQYDAVVALIQGEETDDDNHQG